MSIEIDLKALEEKISNLSLRDKNFLDIIGISFLLEAYKEQNKNIERLRKENFTNGFREIIDRPMFEAALSKLCEKDREIGRLREALEFYAEGRHFEKWEDK